MNKMKATEVFGTPYMTQSAEVEITSRMYISAISGIFSIDDWRGATAEEKAEWQMAMAKKRPMFKK